MSSFDIVLLVILLVFCYQGLAKGLIRLLGKLAGLIAGAFLASHFYLQAFDLILHVGWISRQLAERPGLGKTLSFIALFILATWLVDLLFAVVEKIFNLIAFIPGSKYLNNIAGAVLGLLEGALFLGLIIYVASRYTIIENAFGGQLQASVVAPHLLQVVNLILPVLPEALKALQSII